MHINKHDKALPALISQKEVCSWLGLTRPTLVGLAKTNGFPAAIRLGVRRVAYRVAEVETWLESRRDRIS